MSMKPKYKYYAVAILFYISLSYIFFKRTKTEWHKQSVVHVTLHEIRSITIHNTEVCRERERERPAAVLRKTNAKEVVLIIPIN